MSLNLDLYFGTAPGAVILAPPPGVPNEQPTQSAPYRVAIIGEAPGADEVADGKPFVGISGRLLMGLMSKAGLSRQACFIGNICQQRPPDNHITAFDWNGPEITSGLAQLKKDLDEFKPNICVLLGGTALRAATGDITKKPTVYRGSLFTSDVAGPFHGRKCVCSIHPAAVLRQMRHDEQPADKDEQSAWLQLLYFDLVKARAEGERSELTLPQRNINVNCHFSHIIDLLHEFLRTKQPLSIDIEGGLNTWSSVALAWSATEAIVIPLIRADGTRFWNEAEEGTLWPLLSAVLADSNIPKILQNGLYDAFVTSYSYSIPICGIADDTMLKHWELLCELPKSLALQASIYTNEPYWKDEISGDFQTFLTYNGKDATVTYEISTELEKQLADAARVHYHFLVRCLRPLLYCELKGILYDKETAKRMYNDTQQEVYRRQHALDILAGCALSPAADYLQMIRERLCKKKCPAYDLDALADYVLKPHAISIYRVIALAKIGEAMTPTELGELETLLKLHLNIDSNPQLCNFLYRVRGYDIMYKKEGGRLTTKETTDELALLKLYTKNNADQLIFDILVLRKLITSLDALSATTDSDGRIRCGYNVVGSTTGRLSCYTSPTNSGYNLQTVTRKHRKLFRSDEGYWFFECDLSGADGWTVAAYCAMLGDTTMLDDYRFGLKPANIAALMYQEGAIVNTYSRDLLKSMSHKVDSKGWLYFSSKRLQHGTCYGMKPALASDVIMKDSYKLFGKPIYVSKEDCAKIQNLFLARYPGIPRYQNWVANELRTKGSITAASGSKRIFLGKRDDYDTIKSAYSHLPQHHTTYITMFAMSRCYYDPENRDGSKLIIQPLHQVHDAFAGQFPKDKVDWAIKKIHQWFDNPITIAGQLLTIPFEGSYGNSWGEKEHTI